MWIGIECPSIEMDECASKIGHADNVGCYSLFSATSSQSKDFFKMEFKKSLRVGILK